MDKEGVGSAKLFPVWSGHRPGAKQDLPPPWWIRVVISTLCIIANLTATVALYPTPYPSPLRTSRHALQGTPLPPNLSPGYTDSDPAPQTLLRGAKPASRCLAGPSVASRCQY